MMECAPGNIGVPTAVAVIGLVVVVGLGMWLFSRLDQDSPWRTYIGIAGALICVLLGIVGWLDICTM